MESTTIELHLIPTAVKATYSLFMLVLVPIYLRCYGPSNFLYFCDVALLLTLAGIWQENVLLISVATVGILLPQLFWLLDFIARLLFGRSSGMTDYMFDSRRSRLLRGLSLFHGWLPVLLLYLVSCVGYDPRALPIWIVIASILVVVCYRYLPPPSATRERALTPVNINYVYGFSDLQPQRWMPAPAWLMVCLIGFPLVLYWPAHRLLLWWAPLPLG